MTQNTQLFNDRNLENGKMNELSVWQCPKTPINKQKASGSLGGTYLLAPGPTPLIKYELSSGLNVKLVCRFPKKVTRTQRRTDIGTRKLLLQCPGCWTKMLIVEPGQDHLPKPFCPRLLQIRRDHLCAESRSAARCFQTICTVGWYQLYVADDDDDLGLRAPQL